MDYKKSELTKFAKDCAWGANQMLNGICTAEDITKDEIGRTLLNHKDEELLLEISKRYAKYAKDYSFFDVDNAEVQEFQSIISDIVICCEENNWFE